MADFPLTAANAASLDASVLEACHHAFPDSQRWLVAYSGGVDSHVLLTLTKAYLDQQQHSGKAVPELVAVHINHQLQAAADDWQRHCQQQAEALAVSLLSFTVDVPSLAGQSLEDAARQARYQCFEQLLKTGDVLLMGHHLDDQAETLMLRLLRGSGCDGLAAIPQSRPLAAGHLYRPLLAVTRAAIVSRAQAHQLNWVEDPSNQHTQFDRNYLRQLVMPLLDQRWPAYRQSFARSAALCAESAALNKELAALDWQQALPGHAVHCSLPLTVLASLTQLRQNNLLRYWFSELRLPAPSYQQLQQLQSTVIGAADEASPLLTWPGVEVRRFQNCLYALPPLPAFDASQRLAWQGDELTVAGAGCLSACSMMGSGLVAGCYELRFRQGGERMRPAGRGGSRSLKKLLQELAVPPWLRDRVPLIFAGDELVAVAGLLIAEGWQVGAGSEGWLLQWQWQRGLYDR